MQEILPSPHLVYFQNSLTFLGAPRCKGVSVVNTYVNVVNKARGRIKIASRKAFEQRCEGVKSFRAKERSKENIINLINLINLIYLINLINLIYILALMYIIYIYIYIIY